MCTISFAEAEAVAISPPAVPQSDSTAVAVMKCNIDQIEAEFAYLVITASKHLQIKGVDVNEMLTFLVTKFSSPNSMDGKDMVITVVECATTLDAVFRALSKHRIWDYRNYHLLLIIIKKFGRGDHELNTMMEQYKKTFRSHILVQKMEPFLGAITTSSNESSANEPVASTELFKKLTAKVGVDITEHSLLYVDELWEFLTDQFSLPKPAMILHSLAEGCISITWRCPANLAEHIARMTQERSNVFADRTDLHILRVMLDDRCIYPVKAESSLPEFEGTPKRKVLHQT